MRSYSLEICQEVEYLSANQFKGRIPVTSIINWLDNFEESEVQLALKLLDKVEYFTFTDLSEILKGYLSVYLDPKISFPKGTRLHFIPLGDPGKSGHIVSYLIKNLFKGKKAKGIELIFYNSAIEVDKDTLGNSDTLFFLDDIIGSGKTFLNIACNKEMLIANDINRNAVDDGIAHFLFTDDIEHKNVLLSCIIMSATKNFINKLLPNVNIYCELRYKTFDKSHSPFHSYKTILELREWAYRYGEKLVKEEDILGYSNSQALILFDHATPNNTLPILWSNKDGWKPLLSRSHTSRIENQIKNREDNNRWLIKLSELFGVQQNEISGTNLFSRNNYMLALILRLRVKGWSEVEIARELGIPLNSLSTQKDEGISMGIWDKDFNPTPIAIERVREIEKRFRFNREEDSSILSFDDCNLIYVPNSFGGLS